MTKTKKTHWLRNTICILLVFGVIGLVVTSVQFFGNPDPKTASASVQFSFDGAADGIAPNGTAFDISDIVSDTVLSAALADSSLDGVYTAEQIRPHLVVKGVYPEDMASQVMNYESLLNFTASRELTVGDYHPTTFQVTLYDQFDASISKTGLEDLLGNIVAEYKAYFAKRYANALDEAVFAFDLDSYDYPQQLELIQSQLTMLSEYAAEMFEKDPTFAFEGQGFNDIYVRFINLNESDISRMNANMTMNALTRNTARLLIQYQYEVRNLNNQLEKKNGQLKMMDTLVNSYDKNEIIYLSTTDSLTKIDGNSSETYDLLIDQRKAVADEITQINSQITSNQLKMADLLKDHSTSQTATGGNLAEDATAEGEEVETMTDEEIAAAAEEAEEQAKRQIAALENEIQTLLEKKDAVTADFKKLLTAYNEREINDLTVSSFGYKYNAPKVFSGAFIKAAIMTAGPITAIGFMLSMILIIISRKKEEKM